MSPWDSGVTGPGGFPGPASLQVSQIHDPFLLLLSLAALAPLSPGPFLPVSFWCPDPGLRGQTPGLVFWSWILRARCGKRETADGMKWASELTVPSLGDRYPPNSEARASPNSGLRGVNSPGSYPGWPPNLS